MVDLEALYIQHRAEWIRLARRRVGQDAEDAVHDAMVEILSENTPCFSDTSSAVEARIHRISKTIQQRERRRGIIHLTFGPLPLNGTRINYEEPPYDLRIGIQRALEQVDAPLVLRVCVRGEWEKTLAAEQGCSTAWVNHRLLKALKSLEGLLEAYRDNRKHRFTRRVH